MRLPNSNIVKHKGPFYYNNDIPISFQNNIYNQYIEFKYLAN